MTDINKTLTERGTRYGSFKDNGQLTQQLKQVLRQAKGWDGLDPIMQEALDLTCMKWSRIINGDPFYMDNWHDASGYMTLVHDWLQERFKERPEPKTMHIHEPEVDTSPVPAELREFLEQHGCLDEYVVEHQNCTAEWFKQTEGRRWITSTLGINWEASPSGSDFWLDVDKKWEAHIKAKADR